ncbi:MAG: hypothetical protein KDJ76_00515 [Xanthobacteraceae bacterium]|nr:hypothetical protein [Xanthobacteraceae bacterium]
MIRLKCGVVIGALLLAASSSTAMAQGGQTTTGAGSSMQGSSYRVQAPVGHRQPRRSDFSSEQKGANSIDRISPEDAALNRKLKGICRGC